MNNINRHNYESFFLLYIDNELSVAERRAVDEFVRSNPDLQEELEMFQQSILQPENVVFDNKAGLFHDEDAANNIEEKLLLHLDNELLPLEEIELEALIEKNTIVEKEWNLLQQTKLLPDNTIVFKDKGSLYRKEAGRVVAFPWRRVLAAAVFIGFGTWGGLVYFHNDNHPGENTIAGNTPVKTNENTLKPGTTQNTEAIESADKNGKKISTISLIAKKVTIAPNRKAPIKVTPEILTNGEKQIIAAVENSNNLPKPYFDNVNKVESNKTVTAYVTPEKQNNSIVNPGNNDKVKSTDKQDAANVYAATTASFNDNREESNNHVLFMDEEKIKKTKLGGMFRKVKRVIERNANIKTGGNSIKVANLEFAIQ
jgi:hypothetical protein